MTLVFSSSTFSSKVAMVNETNIIQKSAVVWFISMLSANPTSGAGQTFKLRRKKNCNKISMSIHICF